MNQCRHTPQVRQITAAVLRSFGLSYTPEELTICVFAQGVTAVNRAQVEAHVESCIAHTDLHVTHGIGGEPGND